jgi:sulfite reductase (ferredoxin)
MVRIKLPYGKMTLAQWKRIADVSDEFATGNLISQPGRTLQIHFVSLDSYAELWSLLEQDHITIRERSGNTGNEM